MGNILKKRLQKRSNSCTQPKAKYRRVVPNHLFAEGLPERDNPNSKYTKNHVKTTKYTVLSFLPKNMFEQFHRFANLYFIFIVLLNWIPQLNAFGKEVAMIPVIFVLAVTAIKDAYEDYRRYQSDKKINHLTCRIYSRHEKRYVAAEWEQVRVGDTVHLSCNEVIPADLVLLRSSDEDGFCYIDTSNIDGENNLKQRHVVRQLLQQGPEFKPNMFTHTIECEPPNMEIHKFHGKMITPLQEMIPLTNSNLLLRGCIIRNTDFVEGIVVYAGHDTKALLNNRGPRYKRSNLERLMNRDVIWCILLLILLAFFSALGLVLWLGKFDRDHFPLYLPRIPEDDQGPIYVGFLRFWTFIILYQVLIPLSLYVSVELIKVGQVFFIERDMHLYHEGTDKRIECRALNITEELGQVDYVFSDKTGTLTENKMVFKYCSINGVNYGPPTAGEAAAEEDPNMSLASMTTDTTYGLRDESRDPRLDVAIADMTMANLAEVTSLSPQSTRVQEFFLLLAVCNTVVVSAKHVDQMDTYGEVHIPEAQTPTPATTPTSSCEQATSSLERYSRLSDATGFPRGTSTPEPVSYLDKFRFHSFRRQVHRAQRFENEDSECGASNASFNDQASFGDVSFSSAFSDSASAAAGGRAGKPHYEAESPDELALVHAAANYRCRLAKRSLHHVVVNMPGEGDVRVELMHVLPFDSRRKRMSVIVTHPTTGDVVVYTKGADSAIFSCLRQRAPDDTHTAQVRRRTQAHLDHYARQGYRTLCMAKKVLTLDEYKSWLRLHLEAEVDLENRERLLFDSACAMERNLELLGATGIEDRLQDGVPETITALRAANIKVWVLTGDKQETALNIAHSCNLISFEHDLIVLNEKSKDDTREAIQVHLRRLANENGSHGEDETQSETGAGPLREAALVVDGRTLAYALREHCEQDFLSLTQQCSSVLCVRATPFQKAEVVKLIRSKLKKVTLAIGDGANDVSMIQTADVGIGISGQEGMQAVMASDFALARFRFLKRTLLVHGHWCYDRLARMALYMWYKNSNLIFVLLWYQIFAGFSGTSMLDDMNLILYNLFYTSLPPIAMGIFDQCTDDRTLMANPRLYTETQGYNGDRSHFSKVYKKHSYWVSIADAVYQSLVMFFIPLGVYYGSTVGIWEFGVTICAACTYTNLLHFCIETKHWNVFHIMSVLLSVFALFMVNIVLALVCTACGPRNSPYGVFFISLKSPTHWLTVLLVIVVSLLPRYCIRALQGTLHPSLCVQARLQQRHASRQGASNGGVDEPSASWSRTAPAVTFSHRSRHPNSTRL